MAERRIRVVGRHPMPPHDAFAALSDFEALGDHATAIRDMRVEHAPGEPGVSHWEVEFRSGLLVWSQQDNFDVDRLTIDFVAIAGDPEKLSGRWTVEPVDKGSQITFEADFDIGISSFEDVIDPLAERTMLDNIVNILEGSFDGIAIDRGSAEG